MNELLLIGNPHRRRRRRKASGGKSRRRASPKQRAARARFAAMARARSSGARAARRRPRRRTRARTIFANPVRRSRARRRSFTVARRSRRRNPINSASLRSIVPVLKNASTGAVGAIANDIVAGFAVPFLPAMLSQPVTASGGVNPGYVVFKSATAIGLGLVGKRFLGARAAQMTEGALTVTFYSALRQLIVSLGLGVPMGILNPGRVVPPLPVSQNLRRSGMEKYVTGQTQGGTAGGGMRLKLYTQDTKSREMMNR